MKPWLQMTILERGDALDECGEHGHSFFYIEGTHYQWDCARCNWSEHRSTPSLPLLPSMSYPRRKLVDQWNLTMPELK